MFVLLANRASFLAVGLVVDGGAPPNYCFAVCSVLVPHLLFSSRLVLFDSVLLVALVCGLLFAMYRSSSPPVCTGATGWRCLAILGSESGAVLALNRHALGLWALIMILSWAMICGIWIELSLS